MPGPGAYWIGEEEKKEVLDVFESGHVSRYGDVDDSGFKQKTLTFEKEFAAYTGARFCQATSSGTSTLLISLSVLGIGEGDEVIVPTYTFIASYGAPIFLGPVPHDLGAYPRSDDILRRSINLSVGVVDAGLGSAFGIDINSTDEEIEAVAGRFRRACAETDGK